jgi:hypothetical protein
MSAEPPAYTPPSVEVKETDPCDVVCAKHEISAYYKQFMRPIAHRRVVVIEDNSGSMNDPLDSTTTKTRHQELCERCLIAMEVVTTLNPAGIDLYPINGGVAYTGVKTREQVEHVFKQKPGGYTNLTRILGTVYETIKPKEEAVILIATDGLPTDDYGHDDHAGFERMLRNKPKNTTITIMACTNDEEVMTYLNQLDDTVPGLDVVDDYESEKAQIKAVKGSQFKFSRGDYLVKTLAGSFCPELDNLDKAAAKAAAVKGDECSVM